jgi:uncharacterized membrane protein
MGELSWALSEDLNTPTLVLSTIVLGTWLVFLFVELRRRERFGLAIALSGLFGVLFAAASMFRPARVLQKGTIVGSKVVVLVDDSRRLLLPDGDTTRRQRAEKSITAIEAHFEHSRLELLTFGERGLAPYSVSQGRAGGLTSSDSDLVRAIELLAESAGERPRAVVVLSDGRLTQPAPHLEEAALKRVINKLGVPLHTVNVASSTPKDSSVRGVRAAGAAVAHQPLTLTIEIGCEKLDCGSIPVTIREMLRGEEPAVLAEGTAKISDGKATVELPIVLERAGPRVVEVAIDAPKGDEVPENDRRLLTFNVTRDRIRLLHVAGRPTYDVRALRMWLKADSSIDLVAFFILRTKENNSMSDDSEMALIPFPVDELFTEHLPSFDAIVLQDIDAKEYQLSRHLRSINAYVLKGGGIIMVGGPASFIGGNYAGTSLEQVLPVSLDPTQKPFSLDFFVPRFTPAGVAASVLRPLRALLGQRLPEMPGSNTLGPAQKGSLVLWEHPSRKNDGQAMPVLALREVGDGRTIALGVDGSHLLAFSEQAVTTAGRGYGALWEGLLGWLMRDPRYEAGSVELIGRCFAGQSTLLRLVPLGNEPSEVEVEVTRLGNGGAPPIVKKVRAKGDGQPIEVDIGKLQVGGYTAKARIGAAPPGRLDFACEVGGEAWQDSRPDSERLERIAKATQGASVTADALGGLPTPPETEVSVERHVQPLLPPWIWALGAGVCLGFHWVLRRRGGLS